MEIKPIEDLYKELENQVWSQYPPQFRQISDDIKRMENDNPQQAMALLAQYPEIRYARNLIATSKRGWRFRHPNIAS